MKVQPQLKISHTSLSELPRVAWKDGQDIPIVTSLLHYNERGRQFDYLFHPSANQGGNLYVFFSGDAMRKHFKPPVFQRWSWAKHFPGHCLYVSDPCLLLRHDLALGWYCGTESFDIMESIAKRIDHIRQAVGVAEDRVFAYGSSGGGFAALRFLTFAPQAAAIAVNPQTSVTAYEYKAVEKYLDTCFGGLSREQAASRFPRRFNICESADQLKLRRILLVQNILDQHHYEEHYKPLCRSLGIDPDHDIISAATKKLLFSDKRGHAVAEPPEIFTQVLELMTSDAI